MATKGTKRKVVHGEGGGAKPSKLSFFNPRTTTPKTTPQKLECFICNMYATTDLAYFNIHINEHLRAASKSSHEMSALEEEPELRPLFFPERVVGADGLYLIPNFITEIEEQILLAWLDDDSEGHKWELSQFNGECLTKRFGVRTTLYGKERVVRQPGKDDFPLPPFLTFVTDRLKALAQSFKTIDSKLCAELEKFKVNEFNANSYKKSHGHRLEAHVDDRQLSGPLLANLSLGAKVSMRYRLEKNKDVTFDVPLPRRTLQIVSQSSRYNYTHEIPNDLMEDGRRVSITMRQSEAKHGVPIQAALK